MNFIDKLERRFGRFAIPNLMLYLIILYVLGMLVIYRDPSFYINYLSLDVPAILHGQVWRLITFLMYPPSTNILLAVIYTLFYYFAARNLEQFLGTFRLNLFILTGILGVILAAFLIYFIFGQSYLLVADRLYMSMLLCMALTFPEMTFNIMLFFVIGIPIKAKWLAVIYGAYIVYDLITAGWAGRIAIILSLLNVILYILLLKKPVQSAYAAKRRAAYNQKMRQAQRSAAPGGIRHRCAVCGITEKDDPSMEFRFCSKCQGGREYCAQHLYTHIHVTGEPSEKDS